MTVGFVDAGVPTEVLLRPYRAIDTIRANVTVEEIHRDEIVITEHPVEKGSVISDHAFKAPRQVVIRCGWSNSRDEAAGDPDYIRNIYNQMLALQVSFIPFEIFTGKLHYTDMLIRSIMVTTDRTSENILEMTALCQQVLLVDTQIVTVSADQSKQTNPQKTAKTMDEGSKAMTPGNPSPGGFVPHLPGGVTP